MRGEQLLPPFGWQHVADRWTLAPVVTGLIALAAAAYLYGVWRVRARHPVRPWPWWRTSLFLAGLAAVAVATESGIGTYDNVLFSDHMIQHLLLIMVAPPLLLAGQPVTLLLHASRNPLHTWVKRAVRSRVVTWLTWPPVGIAVYTATIVGTHLTSVMSQVMTNQTAHDGEHALYLFAGYLFFLPILGQEPIRWRLPYPIRLLALVVIMPVDTFTGVILGFANSGLTGMAPRPWGPSPVEDVHSGGAVMWIGGDAIMLALIMLVFAIWSRDDQAASDLGWIESARRLRLASLAGTTGGAVPAAQHEGRAAKTTTDPVGAESGGPAEGRQAGGHGNVDDDEEQLAAYNAYLARLNQSEASPAPPRNR